MAESHTGGAIPDDIELDAAALEALSVPAGLELLEHEVYLDLSNPGHGPFRALPGQTAGTGNRYIAESSIDSALWHALVRRDAELSMAREEPSDPPVSL